MEGAMATRRMPAEKKAARAKVLEKLRAFRLFVSACAVTDADIDNVLASSWSDSKDALLIGLALKMRADAIIMRDEGFPETDMICAYDCPGFFEWPEEEKGISNAEPKGSLLFGSEMNQRGDSLLVHFASRKDHL